MDVTAHTDVAFFDILDPAFRYDSPEVRAAAAVGWWARTPIGLAVLRYQECLELLRDRRLRPGTADLHAHAHATDGIISGTFVDWLRALLFSLEGESHRRLRDAVNAAFTQRSVDVLRPLMRLKAHELIDSFIGDGSCEFMTAFADPYPAWVIAELLGVPAEQFEKFFGWSTDIALGVRPDAVTEQERVDAAVGGLYACCDELIAQRREKPGDDLVSSLIAAEPGGHPLTAEELRLLFSFLVFAGHDTTRNQLGLTLKKFTQHLDQWRLLAQRPELASTAVEELMRVHPLVTGLGRVAAEDFTFHGLDIAAGTHIMLFIAAANTQPDIFGDAPLDITAKRKEQLTFGSGIHYCLGARLARTEMCEALPILASRLGDISLAEPVSTPPCFGIIRPATIPLQFTGTTPRA